jgi:hypothetical protein
MTTLIQTRYFELAFNSLDEKHYYIIIMHYSAELWIFWQLVRELK